MNLDDIDEPPAEPSQTTTALPDAEAFWQGVREIQRFKRALAVPLPVARFDPVPGPLSPKFQETHKNLGPIAVKISEEAWRLGSLRKAEPAGRSLMEFWPSPKKRGRPRGPRLCVAHADILERLEAENPGQNVRGKLRAALHEWAKKRKNDGLAKSLPEKSSLARWIRNAYAEAARRRRGK
jgi:hypothetical protein